MTDNEFEELVERALDDIPERFQKLMNNVAILVEEDARPEQSGEVPLRSGEVLLGLYQGVPLTKRGPNYGMVLPDKITLFKSAILAIGQTEDSIAKLITETVWHEIGHHFGMNEARVREAEKKRKDHAAH
ncbi:hypothetical protein COV04_03330 [Candidatus Uhrbacteria bacterium CG10_big_fil_rev_8_21_14_0_10_48_11]|uniref:Metallopeptidase family protein n=1 Tax=Candidatus Uhrbacteria bacterium CG10_big_fil_rev_8_21_14_0_10_48_11 TaxID=1975037 RepID=A0A2M8LE66_9BACT|nr:MAG: hypothetical protein COV04_03330 [Candidatus Uhrbacteria bacterium CG10_big_fil_rev_8_21_14_0_10_48_11]